MLLRLFKECQEFAVGILTMSLTKALGFLMLFVLIGDDMLYHRGMMGKLRQSGLGKRFTVNLK